MDLENLQANFEKRGDDFFVTPSTGKETSHRVCVCIHCKFAFDTAKPGKFPPVKAPKNLSYNKDVMAMHLKSCPYSRGRVKKQNKLF